MRFLVFVGLLGSASLLGQTIASGSGHGLVLKRDGSVWTWSGGAPVPVEGLRGVSSVAGGDEFSMVLKTDGTVWMWGQNGDGQLGNGTTKAVEEPVVVAGLPRIVSIAAAGKHSMALDSNGSVWGWGSVPNRSSQLTPLQVTKLENVVAIAAGDNHSIALDAKGQVWVWGDHGAGELQDHCFISYYPQLLPGPSDVTAVAGGYQVTVMLRKDGTVWSIGYGAAGQRGDGTTETSTKPVMVSGLGGVRAIAARYMNVMALKGDGTVWGWGSNHYRQLGNTRVDQEDATRPVRAGTLSGVAAIASAGNHSVALTGQGVVWAWGDNDGGGLGADPEALHQSDTPMQPGQAIPPRCVALFSCGTESGKVIRICGDQDESDVGKWSGIHYRFGPESGPPELMFPTDRASAPPALFYSENASHEASIRFSTGGFTYRVSLGGVVVEDATGKRLSSVSCAERPEAYVDYLRENLPCDPKSPRGCRKAAGGGR